MPKDNRETISELIEKRKMPLVAAGLAAMVIGGYITMLIVSIVNGPTDSADDNSMPTGRPLDVRQGRISAVVFDQELNASEGRMGIKGLRELMGGLARGHVLEVAVGTGRNVEFIDWDEIKTAAPLVTAEVGEETASGKRVKTESELQRLRVTRRLKKGKKGMLLPGDEAPEVLSYTGVDVSTDVLDVAWVKLKKAVPELVPRRRKSIETEIQQQAEPPSQKTIATIVSNPQPDGPDEVLAANIGQGRIRLYKGDATQHLPPPPALTSHDNTHIHPAPPYYDTILQNFGLCSVASPHRLLATMASVLRPGTGRIYLLEHGRGSYGWLNSILDKFAPNHFRKYGCWWNRDIEALVRDAEKEVPGLEIVGITRPLWIHGGTTLWVELKVATPTSEQESGRVRPSS